ncbi:hypothetical protein CVT26_013352 [Gymnopilus dilepis]|uniref:Uncharacterized protein n=1 Tax=Gymnopilus dilepis TaxID=231916 RepID=A0A409WDD4_9AGAR|nr:hypothetical protein CVT26_013352 [Gymnopilus dilepis]
MLLRYFTSCVLVISLFEHGLASSSSCMPCRAPNTRFSGWDQDISARGIVYNPRITHPTNNTVWSSGSDVAVTWCVCPVDFQSTTLIISRFSTIRDVRDMPKENSSQKGRILLGYLEDGSQNEHLDIGHPLASDFNLGDGFVTFQCPKVEPRKDYIIVCKFQFTNPKLKSHQHLNYLLVHNLIMLLNTFVASVLFAAASFAAPINGPQELIVFNPPILYPKASSSWAAGSEQIVRWGK